jgi:hypothetical protein
MTGVHQRVSGFRYPGRSAAVGDRGLFSQTNALKLALMHAFLACMLLRCTDLKQADASQ